MRKKFVNYFLNNQLFCLCGWFPKALSAIQVRLPGNNCLLLDDL